MRHSNIGAAARYNVEAFTGIKRAPDLKLLRESGRSYAAAPTNTFAFDGVDAGDPLFESRDMQWSSVRPPKARRSI